MQKRRVSKVSTFYGAREVNVHRDNDKYRTYRHAKVTRYKSCKLYYSVEHAKKKISFCQSYL